MVKRPGFELSLVIKALDQGWQIDEKGQLLLDNDTRNVYIRMLTRTAEKIAELEEQLNEQEAIIEQYRRADGFLAAHGWRWKAGEVNDK